MFSMHAMNHDVPPCQQAEQAFRGWVVSRCDSVGGCGRGSCADRHGVGTGGGRPACGHPGPAGPSRAADGFADVTGGVHQPAIDALAGRGVFDGTECAEDMFCPGEEMKRWTMAVWLVRGPHRSRTTRRDRVQLRRRGLRAVVPAPHRAPGRAGGHQGQPGRSAAVLPGPVGGPGPRWPRS